MSITTLLASGSLPIRPGLRPYEIVLRDLGRFAPCQFVTHEHYLDDLGGYSQGDYHQDLSDGKASYERRVQDARRREGGAA